jgi:hypothetical protein
MIEPERRHWPDHDKFALLSSKPGTALDPAWADVPIPYEVVDPDEPAARCLASTGTPVDAGRHCPVHADGAHRCFQGPGHQAAKSPAGPSGASVVAARCEHVVPEWATHTCDCSFRWANIVQPSA